jgi:HPr kinase/phosphorylase
MLQVNVARLHEDNREALGLAWVAGREGGTAVRREAAQAASLIGHLNLTHPNSIQVIGAHEAGLAERHTAAKRNEFAARLIAAGPVVVVFADGVTPFPELVEAARESRTAIFATRASAARVIETLSHYLAKALAETTELHGVFMDVLGLGVLITGESGVGKASSGSSSSAAPRRGGRRRGGNLALRRRRSRRCPPLLRTSSKCAGSACSTSGPSLARRPCGAR